MSNSFGLTHKDIQSINAAKLYYAGKSQQEVATHLHLSRPTISKLLQHALDRGFVQITVRDPRIQNTQLVDELVEKYKLSLAKVVYPPAYNEAVIRDSLAQAGATMLSEMVRDGDVIGVSWSRTVEQVSLKLAALDRRGVRVVQFRGSVGGIEHGLSEIETLSRFAQAYAGQAFTLGLPAVFDSIEAKTMVEREPHIRNVVELSRKARIAVFTAGSAQESAYLLEVAALSAAERKVLVEKSVGDICARFIDDKGRICLPDLNNRTLAISLPQLRHIPQKLLVAGGGAKVEAIAVALRHGYANNLVTDVRTAQRLLEL